jgi:hypothetical protein
MVRCLRFPAVFGFCVPVCVASAQWEVPVRLELTGPAAGQRQVIGLAAPSATDAAVSLEALRSQAANRTEVSGVEVLTGELHPAPTAWQVGMIVSIVPTTAHAAAPLLALNGSPPLPIVDALGTPLPANTLRPGVPVRLLFDGSRFVLAGSAGTSCPANYTASAARLCIADSSAPAMTFYEANLHCHQQGARLCTMGEWSAACRTIPGFFATVPEAEWVDHAANLTETAKYMGHGQDGQNPATGQGCDFGGYAPAATGQFRVRCCMDR